MDVLYFLRTRTSFIRRYYDTASLPFEEMICKIEAGESPFEPPYSEDSEPAFMEEWSEAHTALEVLGRTCVSMLSESLKLYLKTWEVEVGRTFRLKCSRDAFKAGFLIGYKTCFAELLGMQWDQCPADLAVLEQVTLARNRVEHPENITTLSITHDERAMQKYPQPFFVHERERGLLSEPTDSLQSTLQALMDPELHVARQTLYIAIEQVEVLGGWFEEQMHSVLASSRCRSTRTP